ncbi:DUF1599 domain-containing protein [Acidiluteibacter ferrifornacis]|uniref:DUF1599 domain-containing protein n=1 Tax=Acidiluteibacter ferrifornacis TaxID=2692424 RepID=A0A6N9NNJ9_9FLAO|nr:DUF1599 domain-containing protein [Acidiluteibacter ferrifornacis]MBR9831162.1 DUF1599 domain-containing protein [bacterium]NBG66981.1 DUF1599 domain-containing protein [Acidiluteibacter ferrifornacis]
MNNTAEQYDSIITKCYDIFGQKSKDYGTAWRILRTSSLTDQLYIKAKRIRTIEDNGMSKVDEGIVPEFIAIVNYSIMALIQLEMGVSEEQHMDEEKLKKLFHHYAKVAKDLMMNKNHDYDEAWRTMRVSSLTDLILQKILRVKQIESNKGKTLISEGIDANYLDMLNYAVFALIKLEEQ